MGRDPTPSREPRDAELARLVRRWAFAAALSGVVGIGCIGTLVGTGIDTVGSVATYPFKEWLFAGAYEYDNTSEEPWRALEDDRDRNYGNELVGLAVSGGGSRSAYFVACVLDRLRAISVPPDPASGGAGGPTSLLDEVDFMSSVSGGSLASAYYVLKRPDSSEARVLDPFFARFRADMRLDFEMRSVGRTLLMGRWFPLMFTHFHRGHVLGEVWDSNFFGDATFADLPQPGARHPTLIINATSYSRGSKFLFTRLPTDRFNDSQLMTKLRKLRVVSGSYTELHRPLESIGFDSIESDLSTFPLSNAVAASAGVPSILGPTVLKDRSRPDEEAFEQLGDGGLYDNYGLETLVQLFAKILEERPGLRARIIVLDATAFFDARDGRDEYTVADYADRVTSIAWLRTTDYADLLYGSLTSLDPRRPGMRATVRADGEGGTSPYRNLELDVISVFHEPPSDPSAPKTKPRTLGRAGVLLRKIVPQAIRDPGKVIKNINQEVRGVGTRFAITDEAAAALDAQAELAVRDAFAPVIVDGTTGGAATEPDGK